MWQFLAIDVRRMQVQELAMVSHEPRQAEMRQKGRSWMIFLRGISMKLGRHVRRLAAFGDLQLRTLGLAPFFWGGWT